MSTAWAALSSFFRAGNCSDMRRSGESLSSPGSVSKSSTTPSPYRGNRGLKRPMEEASSNNGSYLDYDEPYQSSYELTVINLHFAFCECGVKKVELSTQAFKFINIYGMKESSSSSKYNITIPHGDLLETVVAWGNDTDNSIFLLKVIADASERISRALSLPEGCLDAHGRLRICIEFSEKDIERRRIIKQSCTFRPDSRKPIILRSNLKEMELGKAQMIYRECKNDIIVDQNSSKVRSNRNTLASDDVIALVPSKRSPRSYPKQDGPPSVIDIDETDSDDEKKPPLGELIIIYRPNEDYDNVAIYKPDMLCLREKEYLNDTMIDFYLRYIHEEKIPPEVASKTHIFSTFFFRRLTKTLSDERGIPFIERFQRRVKRWTKRINIFDKDFLIIPMNKRAHWMLAIVCYPYRAPLIEKCSELPEDDMKRPCMIYMDSLGQKPGERWSDPIRNLLAKEWEDHVLKKSIEFSNESERKLFRKDSMPEKVPSVPSQDNLYDCGLFLLQNVESFLTKPEEHLKKIYKGLPLNDMFTHFKIEFMRKEIKKVILKLKQENDELGMDISMTED
ncbi:uncharacterized protein LOC141854349 [Brevipalpus obovatus]|uniref:uncharacterized protein LOC141854349 n=1 Tax=Brevipalpus obovatus TaxID=246614 RepID=UPI003D9F9F0E